MRGLVHRLSAGDATVRTTWRHGCPRRWRLRARQRFERAGRMRSRQGACVCAREHGCL